MEQLPWLRHYDPGVPPTLKPYPQKTLVDFVDETAAERPDHPFLLFKGARISYREVNRLSDAFAAALTARGVRKGDRVAFVLPNSPQLVVAQLGAWKAGAIAQPVNPLYTQDELRSVLRMTSPVAVVALTSFYRTVKAAQAQTPVRWVIATSIKEYLPPVLRILFTLLKEKKEGHRIDLQPGDVWMQALIHEHAGAPRPAVNLGADDPALLLCTGGTTGLPKAAVQSHGALVMTAMQINAWFFRSVPPWTSTHMLVMPLFHTYANSGVLSAAIGGHNAVALVPNPRDIDDLVHTVKQVRPTSLPGVPTLYVKLLEHQKVRQGKVDLRSIRACLSGAAPLLAETKRRFEAETGGRLVEGYALTESCMAVTCNPLEGLQKLGSIGIPLPDVEVRIVDGETGQRRLATGEVGELVMRAPNLMNGYWESPGETKEALRDGWLYTGDLAYMDEDGYIFIVDRKKDVIKPSGFQVWPREVEEVVASHPAVMEVAVAGIPDAVQSEAVKAWVVRKPESSVSEEEIRAFCREKLAAYKVPRQVEFRDALPKTMIGKVLRRTLRDEERKAHDSVQPT